MGQTKRAFDVVRRRRFRLAVKQESQTNHDEKNVVM
jgi:hypothetical protein